MITSLTSAEEKREIASALGGYCKLDTYTMYAIWKTLGEVGGIVTLGEEAPRRGRLQRRI